MATTNGTNGHTAIAPQVPATKLLAAFVAASNPNHLTPALRLKIKEVLIDYIGVTLGGLHYATSSPRIYAAILGLQGSAPISLKGSGACTVLGKGEPHMLPQYAGLLNSAFGHSLDFDDTHAEGTLHAGVTAISAAMTQAELLGSEASSEDFMLAVAVGYEITCRIGRELGFFSYDRGFHNTGTAGIFGAVAAIASLKRLDREIVEMAFGLAGSKAAGSMQYLSNGSDNKRLHPGFAVHDAFLCVALAEAGVVGATKILEGKAGFLQAYSPNPGVDLERLTARLGEEWIWEGSSLKPFPACRMTHGFIEMAGKIHDQRGGKVEAADVKGIVLRMSPSCNILIGDPTPNKIHPSNTIDAQFSAYYQTANSLIHGSATGMKTYEANRLADPAVHALSSLVTVEPVEGMVGFAADLEITWQDGKVERTVQALPLGEVGHPFTRERVDEKFRSLAEPVLGAKRAGAVIQVVDEFEGRSVGELLLLLR